MDSIYLETTMKSYSSNNSSSFLTAPECSYGIWMY